MHGVGTTFICLSLSNYICNKLGKKTAYIELNTSNEISSLSFFKKSKSFSYLGIDFFPSQTVTSLSEILCLDYEYFVLDMGVLNTFTAKEFSKCNKQFLVCSLSEWKKPKTIEKMEQLFTTTYIQPEQVTILENLSVKESKLLIFSTKHLKVSFFPFVANPFQLETRLFHDFDKILKGV